MTDTELPDDVVDALLTVKRRLKASGMRDVSDFEWRQYFKQYMTMKAAGIPMQGMNEPLLNNNAEQFPASMTPEQAAGNVTVNRPELSTDVANPNDIAPGSILGRNRLYEV